MITIGTIILVIAIVAVLWILFRLLGAVTTATGLPAVWVNVIYWLVVLIVVVWALGALKIMQPIVR